MHYARSLAAALLLAGSAAPALAEGPQDRYWGRLEYFFPTISSTARLDNTTTDRGTELSLEDDLDLSDRKGTPYVLLGARLGEKWRVEFEFYRLNRSATRTAQRDIEWGDVSFTAGTQIDSQFDTSIYRLTGGYSFVRNQQSEFGAAFGLHMTDFETQLRGRGLGPGGVDVQTEGTDQLVPLPTIGLYGSHEFAPGWRVNGRIDYLSLEIDEYDGSLVNSMVSVDWRFTKGFGVGLGYRYVDYKLDATKDNFRGEINYRFKGPTLFIEGAF